MGIKEGKLAVLHQLSQETEPIGLSDLLQKLGSQFVDRSVRRWLVQLVDEGLVLKTGQKRGTRYQVIQRSQRNAVGKNGCYSIESTKIIEQIRRPLFERTPISYVEEWMDAYQPN